MRYAAALALALGLAGCGEKVAQVKVPISEEDKPAYCAATQLTQDPDEKFPEAAIQYLLLGSMDGETVDEAKYAKLAHQARNIRAKLADSDDPGSGPTCVAAYPMTSPAKTFQLPADPDDRVFGCAGLLDILSVSLGKVDPPRMDQRVFDEMSNSLLTGMQASMKKNHLTLKQAEALRSRMTPVMLNLGNSYKVLHACYATYPYVAPGK